jgi:HAD superfamily hydrolase (TIGR01509 family)
MGAIDAVVFDFGNVLAIVDKRACATALARHSSLSPAEVEGRIWGTETERLAETGALDAREHHRRLRDELGASPDWSLRQFQEEFIEGFSRNDEGIEAMRLARSLGKRVFVLSNTSYSHARWLFAQEDLVAIPEGHVFSFKVGVMKPDPAIWRHLLTTRCLAADRCAYVDDVSDYCRAAGLLGFRSVVYTRGRTDLLRELRALLGR